MNSDLPPHSTSPTESAQESQKSNAFPFPDESASLKVSPQSEQEAIQEPWEIELTLLREELETHRDRSLRLAADMENLRRRHSRDLDDTRRYAIERIAGELLPVSDSLEQALGSLLPESPAALRDGLEMTLKLLQATFSHHHIEVLAPKKGDKFNPELHEAMLAQPSAEVPPDCVLDLIQKGYQLHTRLLRPARVIVAR